MIHNEIFNQFVKCYQGLRKMCNTFEAQDRAWMGHVVDHFSTLLIEYAENADNEITSNPFQAKQSGIDLSSMSENQKLESAQSQMEVLYREINQTNNKSQQ